MRVAAEDTSCNGAVNLKFSTGRLAVIERSVCNSVSRWTRAARLSFGAPPRIRAGDVALSATPNSATDERVDFVQVPQNCFRSQDASGVL